MEESQFFQGHLALFQVQAYFGILSAVGAQAQILQNENISWGVCGVN